MKRLEDVLARLRQIVTTRWENYEGRFRDEVRPRVHDLLVRMAQTNLQAGRGVDVTTQRIAQASEQSDLLVEERLVLTEQANDVAMAAVFDVLGELLL